MSSSTFWEVTVPRVLGAYANLIFLVLWAGFITALVMNREWLDVFWNWVQALPLIPKIMIWVLILPVMVGLWIWESSWPVLGRLVGFTGIVVWTFLAVYSLIRDFRLI